MKNKWLYKFTAIKKETKTETKKIKDAEGKETTETITERIEKPVTIGILKPRRRLYEDSDLFYGVKLSEGIKAGLLTKHLIAKRFDNDGGLFSEEERDEYANLVLLKNSKIREYQSLSVSEEDKDKAKDAQDKILGELTEIEESIQSFEREKESLFEKTADARAENQLVMWWIFHLSQFSESENPEDEDFSPIFGYGSYDERLSKYDEFYDEEDEFWLPVSKKLAFLLSFWYNGSIKDEEAFKSAEKLFDQSVKAEKASVEEGEQPKEEEAPKKKSKKTKPED